MSDSCVLVVGTTADYVDIISRRFRRRAVFLTDARQRAKATEPQPAPDVEALCDLNEPEQAIAALRRHLDRWKVRLDGIACFDCESMSLAARIGSALELPYPSAEAVAACRSKFTSKQLWRQAQLPCPDAELVAKASNAMGFMRRINGPVVLKPLTGSGSELTFLCSDADECAIAFQTLSSKLADHPDRRMYASHPYNGSKIDPRKVFVIEECVWGSEYSCDFVLDADRVEILRIARKIVHPEQSFGTILAYILPAELPAGLDLESFRSQLGTAARALGLNRAICMLDFIVRGGNAVMIEMAPRPGGDCLPPLLMRSCGMDILGLALDFAAGSPVATSDPSTWRRLAGVRLFASRPGVISRIDANALREDQRVVECHLKRDPGHRVVLPPEDYDSRLLGHVIFEPSAPGKIEDECFEIAAKLEVEVETPQCATSTAF